jgi:hypothetical protein
VSAVRNLVWTWFPVFGSIPAWAAHVVFIAALTRYSCTEPSTRWTLHAITAATLAVAVLATVMCLRMIRGDANGNVPEETSPEEPGRQAFLGRLGLIIGGTDVLLIVLEELYVVGFTGRSCG